MKTFKQYILENQQVPRIDSLGTKRWYKNSDLHRDDDLPAVEWINGSEEWWVNGKLHREGDKPALKWIDGHTEWFKHGLHHREGDKPAIEWVNGDKEWYKNGERHRENGPAFITSNKEPRYFLEDKEYTKEEFEAEMRRRKMLDAYKRGDTDRNITDDLGDIGHVI